jgi:hypothetical protein
MKKWIITICLCALFLTTMVAWIIEKKDDRALMALEEELHSFKWFNEQIQLNNEVVLSFSKNEATKETVDVSVSSLRNAYQLFLSNMFALDLVETERFKEIDDLWKSYWEYTTFKASLPKNDLSFLQEQGNEFTKIQEELSAKITDLKRKQSDYWWNR